MFRKKRWAPNKANVLSKEGRDWLDSKIPEGYYLYVSSGGFMYVHKGSGNHYRDKELYCFNCDPYDGCVTAEQAYLKVIRKIEKEER